MNQTWVDQLGLVQAIIYLSGQTSPDARILWPLARRADSHPTTGSAFSSQSATYSSSPRHPELPSQRLPGNKDPISLSPRPWGDAYGIVPSP